MVWVVRVHHDEERKLKMVADGKPETKTKKRTRGDSSSMTKHTFQKALVDSPFAATRRQTGRQASKQA
jgi:hypothetical protein